MINRRQWFSIGVVVVMFLAVRFARCPIYSLGWHAIHGNLSPCGDFRIDVPTGWWAASEGQVCLLMTWTPRYTLGRQKPIQVTFQEVTDAPSPSDRRWRQDLIDRLKSEGYVVIGSSDLIVGGRTALCLESHTPLKSPANYVMCNIDKGFITYISYDDARWKDEFYRILRNMRIGFVRQCGRAGSIDRGSV
jgi:hypothetical protein